MKISALRKSRELSIRMAVALAPAKSGLVALTLHNIPPSQNDWLKNSVSLIQEK